VSALDPPAGDPPRDDRAAGSPAPASGLRTGPRRAGTAGAGRRFAARTRRARGSRGYSAFVALAKLLLPVAALGLIAVVVLWPQVDTPVVEQEAAPEARSSRMVSPRYASTDDQGRPYTITGASASGVPGDAAVVEIDRPEADVTLEDGTWLALLADWARFDREGERIHLRGNVELFRDDGYAIRTHEAHVDLQAGESWGDRAVSGHGPDGTIEGSGFRIAGSGDTVVVTGPATLVLGGGARPPGAP